MIWWTAIHNAFATPCSPGDYYEAFDVYYAEAGYFNPGYINGSNQPDPEEFGHVEDPEDYEAAIASAIATWEDTAIAVGTNPRFNIIGEAPLDYNDVGDPSPTFGVLLVFVLDDVAWDKMLISENANGHVEEPQENSPSSGVCEERQMLFPSGLRKLG
jgi:hypothetical protein